jgi:fructose-1,6-bisphosphatase/inositol monophosphatase family enzyme
MLAGTFSFCAYRMTKPWDHAAGALMLTEAGGNAVRFNGAPYGPADPMESGIMASPSLKVLAEVRAVFEAVQMPLLAPPA